MRTTFSIEGTTARQLIRNLFILPANVAKNQLIKALSAAGGVAKKAALAVVAVESGLLKKSLIVKITRAKGQPTGVMVGPSRSVSGYVRNSKRVGAKRAAKLSAAGVKLQFRRPSRYAHLAERKAPAIHAAFEALQTAGLVKLSEKLRQGLIDETAKLASKR